MSCVGRMLMVGFDPDSRREAVPAFRKNGFKVRAVDSVEEARYFLSGGARHIGAVLTEVSEPDAGGLQLIKYVREKSIPVPVVAISGDHPRDPFNIISRGTNTLFQKPVDFGRLASTLRSLTLNPADWLGMRCEHYGFLSDTGIQAPFREHLEKKLKENGFGDTQSAAIVLAVDELYTNGVLHGNFGLGSRKADADAWDSRYRPILECIGNPQSPRAAEFLPLICKKIYVDLQLAPGRAAVTLRDEGCGFDWRGHMEKIKDGVKIGISGFGISLARRIMDEVFYNEEGNEVTVVCSVRERARR